MKDGQTREKMGGGGARISISQSGARQELLQAKRRAYTHTSKRKRADASPEVETSSPRVYNARGRISSRREQGLLPGVATLYVFMKTRVEREREGEEKTAFY